LNHGGDWAQAASSLRLSGYGGDSLLDSTRGVDISGIIEQRQADVADNPDTSPAVPEIPDPGPVPMELLRVPGFVSEVMDHTLAIAPYPNTVMAFAGALALQAFL